MNGKEYPSFNPGDTLKVHLKVKEGEKERIQVFEGVCIAKKNAGINSSFTIRKISYGEGIERVLPLFSPQINKIELVKSGDVRRSKLYYLRKRSGKSARISEKNVFNKDIKKDSVEVSSKDIKGKTIEKNTQNQKTQNEEKEKQIKDNSVNKDGKETEDKS
ncbi:MAG: 50S ribosomal protein L19 [Alphaproteobacteria bacterium]